MNLPDKIRRLLAVAENHELMIELRGKHGAHEKTLIEGVRLLAQTAIELGAALQTYTEESEWDKGELARTVCHKYRITSGDE